MCEFHTESRTSEILDSSWTPACQESDQSRRHLQDDYRISVQHPDPSLRILPKKRLTQAEPFTVSDVDFTRALYIREAVAEKRDYICFLTRATTRVVYLVVVTDFSVQTFVLAYRAFAARRSVPQQTIYDNASTYLLAAEEVTALFPSQILKASLSKQGVDWRFIPKRVS